MRASRSVARCASRSGFAGLARDLLDLSRIDAQVELRQELIDVSELAQAVLTEFDLRARERGTILQLNAASERCLATGDPGAVARIERVVVDNALRYSPPGGRIEIAVRDDVSPPIAVADEGPGIPAADRELIF